MSPVQWYYSHGDEKQGPVLSIELRQLAVAGEISPDDLVWREGMEQWVAARNVKGLFDQTVPKPAETTPEAEGPFADPFEPVSPMPASAPGLLPEPGPTALDGPRLRVTRHLFDIILDAVRAQFTAQFVDATTKIFVTCGHYCLYVAMLASFSVALTLGIHTEPLYPVLLGTGALLILAVLQYAAGRFCVALERLNRTTSAKVFTTVFLDSFAALNIVAGLAVLLSSAVLAVHNDAYPLILAGLVLFVVCEYLAFISLNPQTLSISVVPEARPAEEAIGLFSFLLKAILRLSPVAFGAGVVCGTLWLFYASYQLFGDSNVDAARQTALAATCSIICFAALPSVAYAFILLSQLFMDVIRAVLSIPGKLDAMAEGNEEQREPYE